jgi:hypothetical protein
VGAALPVEVVEVDPTVAVRVRGHHYHRSVIRRRSRFVREE